ncbi:MAG: hypothetical protein HWE07_10760 [Cytophagia bacterium]|nr:hypothetical protein [Cytophagia bacterium]
MSSTNYWAKAPLRLGLAGGGTDVSPYCDLFGGVVTNAAINIYATACISLGKKNHIVFNSINEKLTESWKMGEPIDPSGQLRLLKATYVYLLNKYEFDEQPIEVVLNSEVSVGSGLGSSSTCTVVLVSVFNQFFDLGMPKDEIASSAFLIERGLLNIVGGKQDQYSAVFGGINLMEFHKDGTVSVEPLQLTESSLHQLEERLILYSTNNSRISSEIIEEQIRNVKEEKCQPIRAMHQLKAFAYEIKESLESGDVDKVGDILRESWIAKKEMASGISNEMIQNIIELAMDSGAIGGKVSGAGGGGFMFFYCPESAKQALIESLNKLGGSVVSFQFESEGVQTWKQIRE